ncbi:SprT family zinc-dependent metalloprotease [Streptomyces caniscabiei]|uniref:M48 family metallopeptidase n=1 Tax=Streptomyces caniscabiei TaxID=2746961 RepID=UPI0029BD0EAC|nr:SprT family zinc-dependent metalloprotease [Streptomyces caniscabiei]MDX2775989.1 SprT family zinc-dependent metalloprotease [Streptomyces caniscabiei]
MPTIKDEEFGEIILRRSARASYVRIRVAPDGRLRASLPLYAPLFLVKRLVKASRTQLRLLLAEHHQASLFTDGMRIGKSHTLVVRPVAGKICKASRHGQRIIVSLPTGKSLADSDVARIVREKVGEALRIEAKGYLPRRLRFLADQHGFDYDNVRFSHASGRWGSCSTSGTISLNIALMKLPFELIDYVLVHELCHTVQMNHSAAFWALVEAADPAYKTHRQLLKEETPSI